MKNFLAKFTQKLIKLFHFKAPNVQIIAFDKILYTEFENINFNKENLEDSLFDRVCVEFDIKESFDYALSYTFDKNKALVFLTLDENLDSKSDFAFIEPLIWRNLNHFQADIPPFYAVFVLQENYGFVAFFGDKKLLHLKNLPQFSISHLQNKNEAQRLSFLDEKICTQSRVKELCRLYHSKAFLLINDKFYLNTHLSLKLEIPHFHTTISPQQLAIAEVQNYDEKVNFLHRKADDTGLKRLLSLFVLCFVLGFCFPVAEFFIKEYSLKSAFESEIDEKIPDFNILEKENSSNILILKQKQEILTYIDQELKPVLLFDSFEPLFTLLYQKQIKPQSLKFSDKEITMLIIDNEASAKFIKELYANSLFTLKYKELKHSFYELILERK